MMNTRFKELKFEAVEHTNNLKPLGVTKWHEICEAKFIELVVQECINFTDKQLMLIPDQPEDWDGYHHGVAATTYAIKQHFGVEK